MSRQTKRTKAAKADSGGQNLAPTLPAIFAWLMSLERRMAVMSRRVYRARHRK